MGHFLPLYPIRVNLRRPFWWPSWNSPLLAIFFSLKIIWMDSLTTKTYIITPNSSIQNTYRWSSIGYDGATTILDASKIWLFTQFHNLWPCIQHFLQETWRNQSWTASKIMKLCKKSNFWVLPRDRRDEWGGGWEFIFIYLNFTYVVAKFDFARCLVENVGHGQRLWNCVKSQIFEGYPGAGGTSREGVENLFPYISILPMLWPNLISPGVL